MKAKPVKAVSDRPPQPYQLAHQAVPVGTPFPLGRWSFPGIAVHQRFQPQLHLVTRLFVLRWFRWKGKVMEPGAICGGVLWKVKLSSTGSSNKEMLLTLRLWNSMDGSRWMLLSMAACTSFQVQANSSHSLITSKVQWSLRPLIFQSVIWINLGRTIPFHMDFCKSLSCLLHCKKTAIKNTILISGNRFPLKGVSFQLLDCQRIRYQIVLRFPFFENERETCSDTAIVCPSNALAIVESEPGMDLASR